MSDETFKGSGVWQSETLSRLMALGLSGFIFGPGTKWWPVENGMKVAGPFTTPESFDAWITAQESASLQTPTGDTFHHGWVSHALGEPLPADASARFSEGWIKRQSQRRPVLKFARKGTDPAELARLADQIDL